MLKLFRAVTIFIIVICGVEVNAQETKTVSGIVTTYKNVPLNKVKITSSKTGETAYTDAEGKFTIKCPEKDVLTVNASGFNDRKIRVGKQNHYEIDLPYQDNAANFNNAVSSGHISESSLKKAISLGNLKKGKDYSVYNSIFQLISSEIYNVTVKNDVVYNKKVKSFNSNPQVLYVVDDRVVTNISYIVPADVESIEFVDDVGATMWGVQGANGVLKITLKK
jgi:hypothetical protein